MAGSAAAGFAAFVCCIVLALILGLSPHAYADEGSLELAGFSLEAHGKRLLIHAPLRLDKPAEVIEKLREGAELRLSTSVEVTRHRSWMFNATLGEKEDAFLIRYDPLIREYILTRGEDRRQFKSLEKLFLAAWDATPLEVLMDEELAGKTTYDIILTFNLRHTAIPPWLKRILFLTSWEVVPPLSFTQTVSF